MVFSGDYKLDCEILFDYIKDIKYDTGSARMKKFNIKKSVGGSILYGDTWRGYLSPTKSREWDEERRKYKTQIKSTQPHLLELFNEFRDFHFPDFNFTQVQMNKNYKISRHIDSANCGKSYLVAMGDYTGGLTCIEKEDGIEKVDARETPITFDGSKYYHWVEPFEGDRYSLVFFDY